MNVYIRLAFATTLLSASTVSAAGQLERIGSMAEGVKVSMIPDSITLLEGGIRQVDIVISPDVPVETTPDIPTVTGKMQVNCSLKHARVLDLKAVQFVPSDGVARELASNSPWLPLDETPEDLRTLSRICEWKGTN
jgi:hypothetical protein